MSEHKEYRDASGMRIAYLICVTKDNNNKFYNLQELSNGKLEARFGRVDVTETVKLYEMSDWNRLYKEKTTRKKEPYTDVTEFKVISTAAPAKAKKASTMFNPDRPQFVVDFINMLQRYANQSVEENYTVSAVSVSQAQVDRAQRILTDLASFVQLDAKVDEVNDMLLELYKVIPRRMKHTRDHLLSIDLSRVDDDALAQAREMLSLEQDTLDVMAGQVTVAVAQMDTDASVSTQFDLLESLGLDAMEVTGAEERMIRAKMLYKDARKTEDHRDKFKRAIRLVNKSTDEAYAKRLADANAKLTSVLWHGSRDENWWFIYQQGLKLKPANAVITGKMFGHGLYFADNVRKSMNYTSHNSAAFTHSRGSTGLIALYNVHRGRELAVKKHVSEYGSLTYEKMQKKGYDTLFAEGGYDLRNNEYIVYHETQATIQYLVEVK